MAGSPPEVDVDDNDFFIDEEEDFIDVEETLEEARLLGRGYRVGGDPSTEEEPVPLQTIEPNFAIEVGSSPDVQDQPEQPAEKDLTRDEDFNEVLENFPAYQSAQEAVQEERRTSGTQAGSSRTTGRTRRALIRVSSSDEEEEEEDGEEQDGESQGLGPSEEGGSVGGEGGGEDNEDDNGKGKKAVVAGGKKKKKAPKPPPEDPDTIGDLPTNIGPMPYIRHYKLGSSNGFTDEFRRLYEIPDNVQIEGVPQAGRLSWGNDFIIVPLLAITEGGLRFPIHPFIRQFLCEFRIAPVQLMVNTYRILSSAVKLVERNPEITKFLLGDLMLMYQVGFNSQHCRYYLYTITGFDHLVKGVVDSEKWGNVYVKVSGEFEFGDLDPRFESRREREGQELRREVYAVPRTRQPRMSK